MYIHPNHPRRAELLAKLNQEPPAGPEPSGEVLAEFARPGRGRGPDAKLIVTLEEYNGSRYVGMRIWSKGATGGYFPTPKGASVRLGEIDELCDALRRAEELVLAEDDQAAKGAAGRRR